MSGRDNLNPNQLRMFMTAQELHDHHSIDVMQTPESRYGGAWPDMDSMWRTKRRENKMDGLDKSVREHGVHSPVELTSGRDVDGAVIQDGHHRIQAAFDHNPQSLLPVEHDSLEAPHNRWRGSAKREPVIPEWEDTNRFPSYP